MSIVSSFSQRLGKSLSPLKIPEISANSNMAIEQSQLLRVKNAIIPDTQFSRNLLFEIPVIPSSISTFLMERPRLNGFDIGFDSIECEDILESLDINQNKPNIAKDEADEDESLISENLFIPLLRQIVNGKNYDRKPSSQSNLFPSVIKKEPSGFAKAYKRQKTPGSVSSHETKTLSIWDLLYPVLLPPLNEKFDAQFELFAPLFKFQPAGVEFLVHNESALLADEMGTGKTVMTAVAMKLLFRLGKAKKALIVCPVSLLRTWQDHLTDWAEELEITVVRGTPETRQLDWKYPAHVYLTTYDTIASDFLSKIKKDNSFPCPDCRKRVNLGSQICVEDEEIPTFSCPFCHASLNDFLLTKLPKKAALIDIDVVKSFDVVVLDEAQYIKNPGSQRSRAVKLVSPKFRWALTGTPMENRIDDLVSIFNFVRPGLFKNEYYVTPSRAVEIIKPHFLRRLKRDVMKDLPPKVEQEMWLELDTEQRRAYDAAERSGINEIVNLESVTKMHIFALIAKLKQICNFAPEKNTSAKTEELIDLIDQIKANGQKVLVFSQYDTQGVAKLEPLLGKYGVVLLKGGMSDLSRNLAIHRFRNDPNICVFLATIKVGGVGLTLTEASYVIHFDHWWNPAVMWQANDRVHRTGQKASQVNIYSFWIQNTFEERIHAILKGKGLLFEEVINGLSVEAVENMMSTEDWLAVLGVKPKR